MKRALKDWLIFLVLLLDEVAAVVLVLLVLWFLKVKIPLSATIALALVVGGIAFIFHQFVIPSFRRKKVTGAEGMIGLKGEVIEALNPVGVVRVKGEYWKAESPDGNVPVGKMVEIAGLNGLVLKVKYKG